MYGDIIFCTHGSTIEYGSEIFAAGELTADILNFPPQDYRPIPRLLNCMKALAKQYEATLERGVWWELNNQFIELRSQLMWYRVFQILLKEDDQFLNETQQYTESYSLFTDEEMDEQECTVERCLDLYQKEEEEHRTPPFLLIVNGGREDKWRYYKLQMARYQRYIDDVIVFNPTIHNFINSLLSKLKRNSPEEYAAALYQLYNDERLVEKLIANPTGPDRPFYQMNTGLVKARARLIARQYHCLRQTQCGGLSNYTKETLSELESVGKLALVECVRTGGYDAEKGRFTTYITPFLDGAMRRHLERSMGTLALDRNSMGLVRKAQRLYYKLSLVTL